MKPPTLNLEATVGHAKWVLFNPKELYKGTDKIIGFHPTNQNTLYLLHLFYSDNTQQTSNLPSHWLGQKLSSVQFLVWILCATKVATK